jgi:hypothetical protein
MLRFLVKPRAGEPMMMDDETENISLTVLHSCTMHNPIEANYSETFRLPHITAAASRIRKRIGQIPLKGVVKTHCQLLAVD